LTKKYCIHAQAGVSLTETSAVINPCCLFQSNGEMPTLFDVSTLDNLHQTDPYVKTQQQLQQGLEVTQCSRCTAHEALGIKSKRQHSNQLFSDTTIVPGYVYDLEIALDYTCNMMCRMCSPMSSSKWGAAYGLLEELANTGIDVGYVKHKSYKNYQDQFYKVFNNTSFKYMKHIKIEGGEPFYAKNLEWFLEKLYNESDNVADIKLNIFSNGSIFPDSSILKKLESFQTNITFSLDAYGDLATVIRYGVDWKDIELSLRQWSNYAKNSEIFLCTNTTLNIMNINMVDPLLEFCNDLNIDVNYNETQKRKRRSMSSY
jgi:organic radical activating enzyme